jgi:transposase
MTSMPEPAWRSDGLAPDGQVILGVDTHKDVHVAAVITAVGVLVANAEVPATAAGYRELLRWARGFGTLHRAGVDGTGSYGAAVARYRLFDLDRAGGSRRV